MNICPIKKLRQSTAFIPEELIVEILPLLCVKAILRFKCVSKLLNTLISDPTFTDNHLNKSSQKPHLIVAWENLENYTVKPLSFSYVIQNPSITVYGENYHAFKYHDYIVGSCNGLICLYTECPFSVLGGLHKKYSIYFWNPSTRKISESFWLFPFNSYSRNSFKFVFGYDDTTKTYKVVAFRLERIFDWEKSEVCVFSLGGDCWRNIQSFPMFLLTWFDCSNHSVNSGMHFSGTINWLAIRDYSYPYRKYRHINHVEQLMIISLDLSTTESYRVLLLPQDFVEVPLPNIQPVLKVLMECLCFSHSSKENGFVLWQMKEYGVRESWTQLFKISHQNLPRHCFNDKKECLRLVCLYKNGDMTIFADEFCQNAVIYNLKNKDVEKITVNGRIDWFCHVNVYVESLVTRNGWLKYPAESDEDETETGNGEIAGDTWE